MGALFSAAQTVLVTHLLRVDFQQVCRKQDVFSFFHDTLVWAPQRFRVDSDVSISLVLFNGM